MVNNSTAVDYFLQPFCYNSDNDRTSIDNIKIDKKDKDSIDNKIKSYDISAETITLKDKFKKEIAFINECMLETKIKLYQKVENPKITIIIPLYRTEQNIHRLIQSIQKQEITDIEIILLKIFQIKKNFQS